MVAANRSLVSLEIVGQLDPPDTITMSDKSGIFTITDQLCIWADQKSCRERSTTWSLSLAS